MHAIKTSTAHDSNLVFGRNSNRGLEVEAVNFVFILKLLVGKLHFLGVGLLVRVQLQVFQVHYSTFKIQLGVSHEGKNGRIFPVATDCSGNVVALRDFGNVVPLVAVRLFIFRDSRFQQPSVEQAV